jgi:hypothetical protein
LPRQGAERILLAMSVFVTPETEVRTAAGNRLVDEVIARYVAWRAECDAVSAAYQASSSETGSERVLWFAAFNAALDREECAAEVYSACITRLRWFLWANPGP